VIAEVIRLSIGFQGFLLSDDLGMQALPGGFAERAKAALDAGCDAVLHCSGNIGEMTEVMRGAGRLSVAAAARLDAGNRRISTPGPVDRAALLRRLDQLFAVAA
jgi:beta-N-acetylhexosaminidase